MRRYEVAVGDGGSIQSAGGTCFELRVSVAVMSFSRTIELSFSLICIDVVFRFSWSYLIFVRKPLVLISLIVCWIESLRDSLVTVLQPMAS